VDGVTTGPVIYLGTHLPHWLATAGVPLFVSHRRLASRRALPRAVCGWALDSGGFTELGMHGGWRTSAAEYVAAVERYDREVGHLDWAAPRDWMCEPEMLARTGLSVREHQERTVADFLDLTARWPAGSRSPFVPVLQGWDLAEYLHCVDLYQSAGVDLTRHRVVGVGSVCRRQATEQIRAVIAAVHQRLTPAGARTWPSTLHGFGVKVRGLARYGRLLGSADSLAWSYTARRGARLPGHRHANCANCLPYATAWRHRLLHQLATTCHQPSLFDQPEPDHSQYEGIT